MTTLCGSRQSGEKGYPVGKNERKILWAECLKDNRKHLIQHWNIKFFHSSSNKKQEKIVVIISPG